MALNRNIVLLGVGAGLVLVIAAAWAARSGRSLGAGAVGLAGDLVAGTIEGAGELVGVPRTDQSECARSLAEGRWWDASFACPAGDFLRGVFGSKPVVIATNPVDAGAP